MSQTGPFYFRRIQWAGSYFTSADFDIRDLYIEVERLAGQRVIEVNEDGLSLTSCTFMEMPLPSGLLLISIAPAFWAPGGISSLGPS